MEPDSSLYLKEPAIEPYSKPVVSSPQRHVARIEEMGNAYKIIIGKLEWKRPLGRPKT
jgi:hypothetical protein